MPIENIKSTNHLLSIIKENETMSILMYGTHRICKCTITKVENIALFFWCGGNHCSLDVLKKINIKLSNTNRDFLLNLLMEYGTFTIVQNATSIPHTFGCKTMIICPQNIECGIKKCIQENKKILEPIFNKYVPKDNPSVYLSYILTNGNATYMSWVLKQQFKYGISWYVLQRICNFIERHPQLISKLSKGNIIPYDGQNGITQLTQEMHQLSCRKRVDNILNQFNTNQKKLLKALPKDSTIISSFSKFDQLSKIKQRNFIRKVSTIEDVNEILNQLSFVVSNHFSWNKKSILDYLNNVEGLNYKIVVEKEELLLLDVKDYDTIKRIGKTTNWCISKNKIYWRNYMNDKNRKQYVLIDLTQKEDSENSIIGFTVEKNKGIIAAHSFTNKDMLRRNNRANIDYLNYASIFKIVSPSNIYNILEGYGIDKNILFTTQSKYDWDEDTIIEKIDELAEGNFWVVRIFNSGELLIRVESEHWKDILDNHSHSRWKKYLVYLNFNLPNDNHNRILYVPIDRNITTDEEFIPSNTMYDSYGEPTNFNFEQFIKNKNLDFDIICRTNTLENNLLAICASNNIEEFVQFIDEHHKDIHQIIQNIGQSESLSYFIMSAIEDYFSINIVNILNKYNLRISELTSPTFAVELYRNIISKIFRHLNREKKNDLISSYSNDEIKTLAKKPIELKVDDLHNRQIKEIGKYEWWVLENLLIGENIDIINRVIVYLTEFDTSNFTLTKKLLVWVCSLLKENELQHRTLLTIISRYCDTMYNPLNTCMLFQELSKFNTWNVDTLNFLKSKLGNCTCFSEIIEKITKKIQVTV